MFHPVGSKATVCAIPYMPGMILTGHESGKVALFDADTGEETLSNERAHMDVVTDLQLSADRSYFITSSKDKTARIHDTKTLTVLKTFQTETPLNSAALAPNMPYVRGSVYFIQGLLTRCVFSLPSSTHQVLLGGGQEAMSVTTTSLRQGKFEARFWHRIFEEEVGRVKGHFGPLNTYVPCTSHPSVCGPSSELTFRFQIPGFVWNSIAVHPAGTAYASGGEDGYVRVHHFDESYFKTRPYGEVEILN
jgi:translation initiation factor 3 subunit I